MIYIQNLKIVKKGELSVEMLAGLVYPFHTTKTLCINTCCFAQPSENYKLATTYLPRVCCNTVPATSLQFMVLSKQNLISIQFRYIANPENKVNRIIMFQVIMNKHFLCLFILMQYLHSISSFYLYGHPFVQRNSEQ